MFENENEQIRDPSDALGNLAQIADEHQQSEDMKRPYLDTSEGSQVRAVRSDCALSLCETYDSPGAVFPLNSGA
jgi:hypothetical protein